MQLVFLQNNCCFKFQFQIVVSNFKTIVVSNFHQRDAIGVSTKLAILGIELLARSTNYGNVPFQQLSTIHVKMSKNMLIPHLYCSSPFKL